MLNRQKVFKIIIPKIFPLFSLCMLSKTFRKYIEKPKDNSNFINHLMWGVYARWWEKKQNKYYDEDNFDSFQKHYWNTIGQWRWNKSENFDYSDIQRTLNRYIHDLDITLFDIGTGGGDVLKLVNELFPQIQTFGIDASEKMCKIAKKKSPSSKIFCDFYGPKSNISKNLSFDTSIARSTLTYVDERHISEILSWITRKTNRLLIISEPSGFYDEQHLKNKELEIISITGTVYKRLHDHSHIRDYSTYKEITDYFNLLECTLDSNKGSKQWVFLRK